MFFMQSAGHKFYNRGDPTGYDFDIADFTKDGEWHDLDLSNIIPPNAVAAFIKVYTQAPSAGRWMYLKRKGDAYDYNSFAQFTQAANISIMSEGFVFLNAERIIQYKIPNVTWTAIYLVVRGWFK